MRQPFQIADGWYLNAATDTAVSLAVGNLVLEGLPQNDSTQNEVNENSYSELFADPGSRNSQNLVECFSLEYGRGFVDHRLTQSAIGLALRLLEEPKVVEKSFGASLQIIQETAEGIQAHTKIDYYRAANCCRFSTTIINNGVEDIHLTALAIAALNILPSSKLDDIDVLSGKSAWMAEGRWARHKITDQQGLVDIGSKYHGEPFRDALTWNAASGWSSANWIPVGFIEDRVKNLAIAWQIEHNGSWTAQLSRFDDRLGLSLFGPSDDNSSWMIKLAPGQQIGTPTAAVTFSRDGWQDAAANLTLYRREIRRQAGAKPEAPIVYNDYMNTLMGDPDAEKLAPLISAAAKVGAEVYCIDAGWFADEKDWWEGVGQWEPSNNRFPQGLKATLEQINENQMIAGLWIEPLAVGKASSIADKLPDEAFMHRAGVRIVEQGRYRLNMASKIAQEHLDAVIEKIVSWGIGYLKIDDNYSIGSGCDFQDASPAEGLRRHSLAWAKWLADLHLRYPQLIVETCASGGMAMDYSLLAHADLQSTSDLQDASRYPTIASSAPLCLVPEQAANWAYPQPEMTLAQTVYCLVTGLSGAFYLSGHIDRLNSAQSALTSKAVSLAKQLRPQIANSVPIWPCGPANWDSEWTVLGYRDLADPKNILCYIWHRATNNLGTASLEINETQLTNRINENSEQSGVQKNSGSYFKPIWQSKVELFPAMKTSTSDIEMTLTDRGIQISCPSDLSSAKLFYLSATNIPKGVADAAVMEES